jgi:exopolyphosphatase / guanosine-5'-triphosphate,3'-diphosphate pyrophosphatase
MWPGHHAAMAVGVVDVGSNTVRLLVMRGDEPILARRSLVRLGETIEQTGTIPELKIAETANCVAEFIADARTHGCDQIEVLVTSPGRQATNGSELLERLAAAGRVPVRLLSAAEEGRLAFLGAVAHRRSLQNKVIAVCDVGGGSAQITVGTRNAGAAWTRSIDIGSMRLTSRMLPNDPPGADAVRAARAEVGRYLEGLTPPAPHTALAVGGSARSLQELVGPRLGQAELEAAIEILTVTPAAELERTYGLGRERLRTLTAGTIIFAAIRERLGVGLRLGRGGLREGAALELQLRLVAA